jgi:hypothetical protein
MNPVTKTIEPKEMYCERLNDTIVSPDSRLLADSDSEMMQIWRQWSKGPKLWSRPGRFLFRFGAVEATILTAGFGPGTPVLPLGNPNPFPIYDDSPRR